MTRYTKESVQKLRDAIDIVDLITRYVPLKRAGVTFKGLCPFHDEKTPSFTVNKSSKHYHCFGCGAHGDAVAFLMEHERLDFRQALEFLSERFGVALEVEQGAEDERRVSVRRLRAANEAASQFYHTYLLHAHEASGARDYLASRRFSLAFLQAFSVGYAPAEAGLMRAHVRSMGYTDEEMVEAGLLARREGGLREFFSERITFPILDSLGNTIGFSARKWKEETFGGKYINTHETELFKKSKILFGCFYSKKRMMKDRLACLVEGQLDALRLIEAGFDFTVATLGTAFGSHHVDQLRAMGVEEVYLAFDQDEAGLSSAEKAGQLLMKQGVGVKIVRYSGVKDPDELLATKGKTAFFDALASSAEYIPFLVDRSQVRHNWSIPREKDAAVRAIADQVREWNNPIHVFETLRQLASLAKVPEQLLNIPTSPKPSVPIPRAVERKIEGKDPDLLLELDLIRWLLLAGPLRQDVVEGCSRHVHQDSFVHEVPRQLFLLAIERLKQGDQPNLMDFAAEVDIDSVATDIKTLLSHHQKAEKAPALVSETIKRINERNWLREREEIRKKMEDSSLTEAQLTELVRSFDQLSKTPPTYPIFD